METQLLQQFKDHLLRAGVDSERVQQASEGLTPEQLQLISQILPGEPELKH